MMTIAYPVLSGLYINMTNRCPCDCTFCLRQSRDSVYGSDPLWLDREPTVEEVCAAIDAYDLSAFKEIVFCGYGEPTERLDDLLEVARYVKAHHDIPLRINTNGLADLIHGEPTAPRLQGLIDTVSVSLNATNAADYEAVVRPKFGAPSFDAMLRFTKECTAYVPHVVMTVVGEPVTSKEEQATAAAICESVGATLRIRPYED